MVERITKVLGWSILSAILLLAVVSAGFAETPIVEMKDKTAFQIIADDPELETFEELIRFLGFDELSDTQLDAYTFFAPSDEAIARARREADPNASEKVDFSTVKMDAVDLSSILFNHTVRLIVKPSDLTADSRVRRLPNLRDEYILLRNEDGTFTVDGVPVRKIIQGSRGLVYVIDQVLVPGRLVPKDETQQTMSLVDTLKADEDLYMFVQALERGELLASLEATNNPVTVFAPTNDAILQIEESLYQGMMETRAYARRTVLYHFTLGEIPIAKLRSMRSLRMVSGDTLTVRAGQSGRVTVGTASVVEGDIKALNGVIHKVDRVMIPPAVANLISQRRRGALAPPEPGAQQMPPAGQQMPPPQGQQMPPGQQQPPPAAQQPGM